MRRIYTLVCVLCLSAVIAYAQQWHTSIEVLHPASLRMPSDIFDLLIVNNTVPQLETLGHVLLRDGKPAGQAQADLSQASLRVLFAVTQTLDYSRLFASVGLLEVSRNTGTFFNRQYLTAAETDSLASDYQADALLVLNQVVIYDKTETFLTDEDDYYSYFEAYGALHWTLCYPDGRQQTYTHADTLVWESRASSPVEAAAGLPLREQALLDMAAYMGESFANRFIPAWEQVDRYLYQTSDNLLLQGLDAFVHRRFAHAASLWNETYHQASDTRVRAYAAADIALALELLDESASAVLWAEAAAAEFARLNNKEGLQQQINMRWYAGQLRQRAEERTLLAR